MPITHAHSFLVHPGKSDQVQLEIGGVAIRPGNKVFTMLSNLYEDAHAECNIEIVFRPTDGQQQNPCRDLMVAYARNPNMENGRAVADRLQRATTHRSGLGLFFLALGDDNTKLLMVSRFPADQGVVAQETDRRRLEVEFIERVFMKSARAYKSALYPGPVVDGGFWEGRAVDKQIDDARELSNYWIGDFLDSELRTTGPAGTKRLAVAIREAIREAGDSEIRDELMAATRLARGYDGRVVTAHRLSATLGLSLEAITAVGNRMQRPELFEEPFRFDREEFDKHVMYRSIELDNGAVLTAENSRFEEVFQKEQITDNQTVYSTTGNVIAQRLKKTL